MAGNGEVLNAGNLNGLKLAKSGRTTGLTCSTVTAIDLSVKVDYFKDCAETQPYYTKTFTNQIGIGGEAVPLYVDPLLLRPGLTLYAAEAGWFPPPASFLPPRWALSSSTKS